MNNTTQTDQIIQRAYAATGSRDPHVIIRYLATANAILRIAVLNTLPTLDACADQHIPGTARVAELLRDAMN